MPSASSMQKDYGYLDLAEYNQHRNKWNTSVAVLNMLKIALRIKLKAISD